MRYTSLCGHKSTNRYEIVCNPNRAITGSGALYFFMEVGGSFHHFHGSFYRFHESAGSFHGSGGNFLGYSMEVAETSTEVVEASVTSMEASNASAIISTSMEARSFRGSY